MLIPCFEFINCCYKMAYTNSKILQVGRINLKNYKMRMYICAQETTTDYLQKWKNKTMQATGLHK